MNNFTLVSGGKNIFGEIMYPDKLPAPAVVLLHGFTNNIEDCPVNKDLFKILPSHGFISVQFDFIGSGKSDGQFSDKTLMGMYQNYKDVIDYIKKDKNVSSIGIVGKSVLGVFPVMANDGRVKSVALLSTAVRPTIQFYRIWENDKGLVPFGINASGAIKGPFALPQKFFEELKEIDETCVRNLPKIKNIIHFQGTVDKSVPFDQGHYFYIKHMASQPFKSVLIEGVGHGYDDKQDLVIKEVIEWFSKYLK